VYSIPPATVATTAQKPETENLQPELNAGTMNRGSVGDTDGYTEVADVRQINFNDDTAVAREIEQFASLYANAEVEHARVISPSGNVYTLRGSGVAVNPGIINRNELAGSIIVHNHPAPGADSFSRYDFISFFDFRLSREDVVFGNQHHSMHFNGTPVNTSRAADLYRAAFSEVQRNALMSGVPIRQEQLETMRQLSRTMEGLSFDEYS